MKCPKCGNKVRWMEHKESKALTKFCDSPVCDWFQEHTDGVLTGWLNNEIKYEDDDYSKKFNHRKNQK